MSNPVITLDNVGLAYSLARNRPTTVKGMAIGLIRRQVVFEDLWALRNLTLDVSKGSFVGVVGPNGAGKSTLLKIIARILAPSEGRIVVRGDVAPMIELAAGFDPELTTIENVVLGGTLLGRSPTEMRARVADILGWAELTDFADAPVRTFSSGMLARLGFAVATDLAPDVLLVDEVFAVGDAVFQRQSAERVRTISEAGTTVLLVSHDLDLVERSAERTVWIDHGRVREDGRTTDVLAAYRQWSS